jgi:tetrahydromethanopterin S-methyltransferase subunit F
MSVTSTSASPDTSKPSLGATVEVIGFLLFIFVLLPFLFYVSHVEEKDNDAWIDEAPQVEKALNDFYVEDISYDRELLSRGRGLYDTEIAAVNGEVRTDCIAVVWKDGSTISAAGLECSEPITLTAAEGALLPLDSEPEPPRN